MEVETDHVKQIEIDSLTTPAAVMNPEAGARYGNGSSSPGFQKGPGG